MGGERSESGFTLVELLVATVISGIIIGAIATALIVTFSTYPQSASGLSSSDNAHLLSSWLVGDVQSAGWSDASIAPMIDTSPTNTSGCGGIISPTGNVVTLSWSDLATGEKFQVGYRLVGSELKRYFCKGGSVLSTTVVGRDIGSAVATPTVGPPGCVAGVYHCQDSVNVHVQSNVLVNGSAYSFDVSASRRTPALRIFAMPTINSTQVNSDHLAVRGTAEPNAVVTLKITDTSQPVPKTVTVGGITAAPDGSWDASTTRIELDPLLDGPITFQVTAKDGAGHTSTATTTATKDTTPPPSATVTALFSSPTSSQPLLYQVTFSKHVTTLTNAPGELTVSAPPANTNVSITVSQASCSPPSDCFSVSVAGLNTDDTGDGQVSVNVNPNAVTDDVGNANTPSKPVTVLWDANAPSATIQPLSPSLTNVQPLQYLVTFSKQVTPLTNAPGHLTVSVPPANTNVTTTVSATPCPPPSDCFTVAVSGLSTANNAGGAVSVTVKAGAVTDQQGLQNAVSSPAIITWSPP